MIQVEHNRLFFKVFRLLFIGIVTVTTIFGFLGVSLQKESIIKLLHSEAKSIAQSITFVTSDALIIDDNSYLIEFNSEYIKNSEKIKSIIIYKMDKSVFSIKKKSWAFDETLGEELLKMQQEQDTYKILTSPVLNEEVFHYTYPIYFSGISWGWLHLSFDLKEYNQKIKSLYLNFAYLLITLLLLSFVISYYIAKLFSNPIIKLNQTLKEVNYENMNVRVDIKSDDEIGELAQTFNKMIVNLADSKRKLKAYNEDLERRVQERTYELEAVNDSLKQKSSELSELNKNLDSKVKNEISKRREQEEMLIYQSRLAAMGEMIGNIAHQWRQPLNALSIIMQNIYLSYTMKNLSDEFMEKSVNDSVKLTKMMSKTIDDFRNFFRPNKIKEVFNLQDSVDKSLELIDSSFKNYDIHVELVKNEEAIVFGFPNEFAQAVLNILSNAKDALIDNEIENPSITVTIDQEDEYGVIRILDNAGGISPKVANKIFEPYFTTKEEGKGTGIGLYMSKIIIEQNMSGKVSFQNLEAGAEFCLYVPLNKS